MKPVYCLLVVAVVSACSDAGVSAAGGAGQGGGSSGGASLGAAGERSSEAGAAGERSSEAGAAGQGTALSIWDDQSELLEVHSGNFFSGYFGYVRTRAQLSAAQLSDLENLRTAPDLQECLEDGLNIVFTVSDADGNVAHFRNDSCSESYQTVDPAAAERFVNGLPKCLLSKDPRTEALQTAPSVAIGDGCENGLFTSSADSTGAEAAPKWLRLTVTTPNEPVLLELADCGDRSFNLELLDEAGETLLAAGAPSGDSCQSLRHSFATAGSYVVRVTLTRAASAGDFTLRAN